MVHIQHPVQRLYRIVNIKSKCRSLHQWRRPATSSYHICPVPLRNSFYLSRPATSSYYICPVPLPNSFYLSPSPLVASFLMSPLPMVARFICPLPMVARFICVSAIWTCNSVPEPPLLETKPWWEEEINFDEDIEDELILDETEESVEVVVEDVVEENKDIVEELAICPHCGKGFVNESALQEHIDKTESKHGGCNVLRKTKNKQETLAGQKWHICEICELGFPTKSQLKQHRRMHNNSIDDFKCGECGKTYKYESSLKRHLKDDHSSDKKYVCPECKKTFCTKATMMRHIRDICSPKVKPFECDQCKKRFKDNTSLLKHVKWAHNTERSFKCDKCNYTFAFKSKLLQHIKYNHKDDRPHQCEYCSASFKTINKLKHHRTMIHTFDWPHICQICGEEGVKKGFYYPVELKKHMLAHHPTEYLDQLETEMPEVCNKCNKRFSTVQELSNHYRKVHALWMEPS